MAGYVALPAYRVPTGIDFSPLNSALDDIKEYREKNRLLEEARAVGSELAGTQPQSGSSPYEVPQNRLMSPAQGAAGAAGRDYPGGQGDMDSYKRSISAIESGGRYDLQGPVTRSGDRAFGKYQVMGANVGPWTREVLGREMSPQEFLANADAQEKVFQAKFGQYVQKTGNPQDAASMWFTGRPAAEGANRRARNPDGSPLGITGSEYVRKFNAGLGGGGQPAPAQAAPASAPSVPNYRAAAAVAFRQGNVALGTQLLQQQRQIEETAYDRNRQGRADARAEESHELSTQASREELQSKFAKRIGSLAQVIQSEADPAKKAAMWQRFTSADPRITRALQAAGVDPSDVAAGTRMLIAEAQGGVTPRAPQEVNGRLVQQQPDGTFKEVYAAPPKAKNLSAAEQKEVFEADEGVQAAGNVISSLDKALEINDKAYSGPAAQTRGYVTSLFGSEGGEATEALQNVVLGQVLDNLKATFGAAPTEGERQILIDLQGSVNKSPEVRRQIFERAKVAAQRRLQFSQNKAGAIRGGEYFQPGYSPSQQPTAAPAPQATPAPARVTTEQEYMALPSGTPYVAPDGSIRTKK